MTCWMLALKRFLRPGRLLLLLLISLAILGGRTAGHQAALRPCGILCQDDHPAALAVRDGLLDHGFTAYDDLDKMTDDISKGVLDCGAVLLPGIGQAVEQGEYAGFVQLFTAPDSFLTETYQAHITAALYTAAAPAMIRQASQEAGIPLDLEAILQEWNSMMSSGYRFTFEVVTTQGTPPESPDYGQAIATAAGALLLFAAVVPGTVRLGMDANRLQCRIGRKNALLGVLLPGLVWQLILSCLAAAPWMGETGWAVPGYLLALTGLGLLLARLPVSLKPLLPLALLGALAMMPIYFDLTGLYPQLLPLRCLLPPCWLFFFIQHPLSGAGISALITTVILVLYPRRRQT